MHTTVAYLVWPLLFGCCCAGSTTHIIDTSRGLVVEHIERWKSEPGEVRWGSDNSSNDGHC
jgi:Cys-tRNA synthase (O-phospho-L-seryl-tRNA:Cys-tRNA synthase)